MTRRKKFTLWIAGILASPIVLSVVLATLLYLPPVQRWAVREVSQIASEQTGWDIRLERVRLKFILDLDLQNVSVTNPDTLLAVDRVVVDLGFSKLPKAKVVVQAIDIQGGNVDTQDLIAEMRIRGSIGDFHMRADAIDLLHQSVDINEASLALADIDIAMQDTTVVDTTESEPVSWTIRLGNIEVRDTRLAFHLPGDTMSVQGCVDRLTVEGGSLLLEDGIYNIGKAELVASSLLYDMNYEPRTEGFDYNHIALSDISLGLQDIRYTADSLSLYLADCGATERSGITLSQLRAHFLMSNDGIELPDIKMATPHSLAEAAVSLDWDALEAGRGGRLEATLSASVGREDVGVFVPDMAGLLPDAPIELGAKAGGNVDCLDLPYIHLSIAPMVDATATGVASNLLDMDRLGFNVDLDMDTYDLSMVNEMADLGNSVVFPHIHVDGLAAMEQGNCTADLSLQQAEGRVELKAGYDLNAEAYSASLDVRSLQLHNFLPGDSLRSLSASLSLSGAGTDVFSKAMRLNASLRLDTLGYGPYEVGNVQLMARLEHGLGMVDLYSDNRLLKAQACMEAELSENVTLAGFNLDVNHIDLYDLGLVDKPFAASMLMHVEGNTNLSDRHSVEGSFRSIEFVLKDTIIHPLDLHLAFDMLPDSLYAMAKSGDMKVEVGSCEGLDSLLAKGSRLADELMRQCTEFEIDQLRLKGMLPYASAHLSCGTDNPLHNTLYALMGYRFGALSLDLESDPTDGLSAVGSVLGLNTGGVELDTIRCQLFQDALGVIRMDAHVENNERNRQVVFSTDLTGSVTATGVSAGIIFRDEQKRTGVELGAAVEVGNGGITLKLQPQNPIVAYRTFTLNEDNYIYLGKDHRLRANVDLVSDDGTGLKLYSTPNGNALQDITLSIHDLNLGELTSAIPYAPDVRGMLGGDFHLVLDDEQLNVSADASVADLAYEGAPLGTIGMSVIYLPNADGTQYVDATLSHDGNDVMFLSGTYDPAGEGVIDAVANMQRLPLSLANGFIPDQMAGMDGYVEAALSVSGSLQAPLVNGILYTDSLRLYSDMYSLDLRIPDDTLAITDNYVSLNRLEAYSASKTPLVIDGSIDCRDFGNISLDLSVEANDFELINAPKTHKAVAYGKVYVDLAARLTGTLNDMGIRGAFTVLGNTDVSYVLTDSPLSADDQLAELVEFVDFNDTIDVDTAQIAPPQNLDIQMELSIEQTAQVHCLLSADGSNRIDLEGGGDFTMGYNPLDGLTLFGRYLVVSGEMNYSIMVLSLKDCTIQSGSYVEFTGEVMNPRLSLSASERVKSTVYEDSTPRTVGFDVGVSITQTLENMGLEFTLEAPEDLTISNELATLTAEGRSKVAVTLLVTGMYISEEGASGGNFSASDALNSFLQSQISSISNRALSTVDINFGVDNTSTASGGTQTDYNFSFAKHFWGNRISIIIGGKVSTGDEVENTGQSIIDNVSIEYRLDRSATRYVRVYYDKNTESLLEGEITEMGAGVVLRRKSNRLGELFVFKRQRG